jgi:hypothetical protein
MSQPPHGFDVLSEYLQAAGDHGFHIREVALEVRRQRFYRRAGIEPLDFANAGREMCRTAISQIVAVHGCQHHVLQAHQLHGMCAIARFVAIQPAMRVAGIDGAEATRASADRAHEHQGRSACIPALADVRTLGFLADGGKPMLLYRRLDGIEAGARGHPRSQPLGFASRNDRFGMCRSLDAILDRSESLQGAVLVAATRRWRSRRTGDDGNTFELIHVGLAGTQCGWAMGGRLL